MKMYTCSLKVNFNWLDRICNLIHMLDIASMDLIFYLSLMFFPFLSVLFDITLSFLLTSKSAVASAILLFCVIKAIHTRGSGVRSHCDWSILHSV